VHESGHEWFANNITYRDIADMWIHESFTAYSESLFLEYHHGKKAGYEYVIGTRKNILNDRPLIGTYHVNHGGSGDMYYKGANMLHTLRQVVNDDQKWRKLLRGLNQEFYHQTVTTAQIEKYISKQTGQDLTAFFQQYLRDVRVPVLEYRVAENKVSYRWANCVPGFKLPVKVVVGGKEQWWKPTAEKWKEAKLPQAGTSELVVDANFYVTSKRMP
jgi:aminopeptidase N